MGEGDANDVIMNTSWGLHHEHKVKPQQLASKPDSINAMAGGWVNKGVITAREPRCRRGVRIKYSNDNLR